MFREDFSSEIAFRLTELRVSWSHLKKLQLRRQNFNSFLKTQLDTLEIVKFDEWMGFEILKTILSMARLQKLTLGYIYIDPVKQMPAWLSRLQSQSVTSLDLPRIKQESFLYDKLFQAFPNVENLVVYEMTSELSYLIRDVFKSLKKLTVRHFSATNLSLRAFQNVEILEVYELSDEIADWIPRAFNSLKILKIEYFCEANISNISNIKYYSNLEQFLYKNMCRCCPNMLDDDSLMLKQLEEEYWNDYWRPVDNSLFVYKKTISEKVRRYLPLVGILYYCYYFFYLQGYIEFGDTIELFLREELNCTKDSDMNSTTEYTFIDDQYPSNSTFLQVLAIITVFYMIVIFT